MIMDKSGFVWKIVQRYHTNNYLYYVICNVLTGEEKTVTDWKINEQYIEISGRRSTAQNSTK